MRHLIQLMELLLLVRDIVYTTTTTAVEAWCISINRTTYIHVTMKLVIVTNIICLYYTKAVI